MNPLPTVSQAYAYVKQDERARQGHHSLQPIASWLVNSVDLLPVQRVLFLTSILPLPMLATPQSLQSSVLTAILMVTPKSIVITYKLIGYPPNWKKREKTAGSNPSNQFRTLAKVNLASKKQTVTSMSTVEAEYRALATITTELIWLKYLLIHFVWD